MEEKYAVASREARKLLEDAPAAEHQGDTLFREAPYKEQLELLATCEVKGLCSGVIQTALVAEEKDGWSEVKDVNQWQLMTLRAICRVVQDEERMRF